MIFSIAVDVLFLTVVSINMHYKFNVVHFVRLGASFTVSYYR